VPVFIIVIIGSTALCGRWLPLFFFFRGYLTIIFKGWGLLAPDPSPNPGGQGIPP